MDHTQDCRIEAIQDLNFAWAVKKDYTKKGRQNALRQIREEAKELAGAIKANDDVEQLDALCDLIWVAVGYAYRMNWDISGALDEVYASNFSKLLLGNDECNPENLKDSFAALEAKGREGLRVVTADYGDSPDDPEAIPTGSIQDKFNKVQKPLKFLGPDLRLYVNNPELRKQALEDLASIDDEGESGE